jgi:hypothetical protein
MLGAKRTEVSLRQAHDGSVEYVIPEASEGSVPQFPVPQPMQEKGHHNVGADPPRANGNSKNQNRDVNEFEKSSLVGSVSSSPARISDRGALSSSGASSHESSQDGKRDRLMRPTGPASRDMRASGHDRPGNGAGRSTDELSKVLESASQRIGMLEGLLSAS